MRIVRTIVTSAGKLSANRTLNQCLSSIVTAMIRDTRMFPTWLATLKVLVIGSIMYVHNVLIQLRGVLV